MAEPAPKKVKLVDFSAASAFYGSRKGYAFKTGEQGLGYYLDDVGKAKERVLEGLEGPGLFCRAPAVDVEAPQTAPAEPAPAPAAPAPAAAKKKRFDPYADLPAATKKAAPARRPPTPEVEEKAPVKVFTSGLFKLEQVHCLHIVRKHKDARNPTSWRHPGRRIDRSRQDATDELEKMRTKLLAGPRPASFLSRRGDGVPSTLSRLEIDAIDAPPRAAPTHRRRSLFMDLAKKFSECGSAKKGGDLGMFRRGKMSAAFELAAFNLDVFDMSKRVASSSGVHLVYRLA